MKSLLILALLSANSVFAMHQAQTGLRLNSQIPSQDRLLYKISRLMTMNERPVQQKNYLEPTASSKEKTRKKFSNTQKNQTNQQKPNKSTRQCMDTWDQYSNLNNKSIARKITSTVVTQKNQRQKQQLNTPHKKYMHIVDKYQLLNEKLINNQSKILYENDRLKQENANFSSVNMALASNNDLLLGECIDLKEKIQFFERDNSELHHLVKILTEENNYLKRIMLHNLDIPSDQQYQPDYTAFQQEADSRLQEIEREISKFKEIRACHQLNKF